MNLTLLVMCIACIIFGSIITIAVFSTLSLSGEFEIIESDSEGATCKISLGDITSMDIETKKYIVLKISQR